MDLLVVAVAPGLALLSYFYLRDKYEREPRLQVLKVFVLGMVTLIPAGILEGLAGDPTNPATGLSRSWGDLGLYAFGVVALVEEGLKFLVVWGTVYRTPHFNEVFDGIVYGVAASLGFATGENLFYVFEGGLGVGIARALLAVPGHALFGVIWGYFLGRAKFTRGGKAGVLMGTGLGLAILLHGTYDFLLFTRDPWLALLVYPLVRLMWVVGLRQARLALSRSPFILAWREKWGRPGPDGESENQPM